jgi:glycerophosphoryl diester phosphodiesterase
VSTRWIGFGCVLCLLLAGCGDAPEDEGVRLPSRLLIAHRGFSAKAPENTLPAFRLAVEAGADLVELDYVHSKEGVPVAIHDKTLDRTTNVRRGAEKVPVATKTMAELRALDAGAWFDARFAGTRLPTVEEALEAIHPGAVPLIERKAGDAATLVALLERKGLLDDVVVQAFDWAFLAACRRLAAELRLCALGSKELTAERLAECVDLGVLAIGWKHRDLTAALVESAHARGLKVWAYTVNDVGRAHELVAMGVDGIITDEVETVGAVVR